MRFLIGSGLALVAAFAAAPAFADVATDRAAAIALCREEVGRQVGVDPESIPLDQIRARGRGFRVDLDLWRDGQLTNVRCDTVTGETQTIAEISPALAVATASAN